MDSIRFPTRDYFPLYEVPPSKTPFSNHPEKEVILAIPNGKKVFCWFTNNGDDVCYMVPRNYKTQPEWTEVSTTVTTQRPEPFYGTLLSGTLVYPPSSQYSNTNTGIKNMEYFIADDIFYYAGISLTKSSFCERLEYLLTFFHQYVSTTPSSPSPNSRKHLQIMFVNMRGMREPATDATAPKYRIHHWQLRNLDYVSPYFALPPEDSINPQPPPSLALSSQTTAETATKLHIEVPSSPSISHNSTTKMNKKQWVFQYHYPAYKQKVIFRILPETQCDVYTLYARSNNSTTNNNNTNATEIDKNTWFSCGYAGIFEYQTSQLLNRHCRNQYSEHLDQLEESDDEKDEEDEKINTPLRVNNSTAQYVECTFSAKFRKWVPQTMVPECPVERVVSMNELAIYTELTYASTPTTTTSKTRSPRTSPYYKNSPYHHNNNKYPQPPLKTKSFYKNK